MKEAWNRNSVQIEDNRKHREFETSWLPGFTALPPSSARELSQFFYLSSKLLGTGEILLYCLHDKWHKEHTKARVPRCW